jgi:hypothetical protein
MKTSAEIVLGKWKIRFIRWHNCGELSLPAEKIPYSLQGVVSDHVQQCSAVAKTVIIHQSTGKTAKPANTIRAKFEKWQHCLEKKCATVLHHQQNSFLRSNCQHLAVAGGNPFSQSLIPSSIASYFAAN